MAENVEFGGVVTVDSIVERVEKAAVEGTSAPLPFVLPTLLEHAEKGSGQGKISAVNWAGARIALAAHRPLLALRFARPLLSSHFDAAQMQGGGEVEKENDREGKMEVEDKENENVEGRSPSSPSFSPFVTKDKYALKPAQLLEFFYTTARSALVLGKERTTLQLCLMGLAVPAVVVSDVAVDIYRMAMLASLLLNQSAITLPPFVSPRIVSLLADSFPASHHLFVSFDAPNMEEVLKDDDKEQEKEKGEKGVDMHFEGMEEEQSGGGGVVERVGSGVSRLGSGEMMVMGSVSVSRQGSDGIERGGSISPVLADHTFVSSTEIKDLKTEVRAQVEQEGVEKDQHQVFLTYLHHLRPLLEKEMIGGVEKRIERARIVVELKRKAEAFVRVKRDANASALFRNIEAAALKVAVDGKVFPCVFEDDTGMAHFSVGASRRESAEEKLRMATLSLAAVEAEAKALCHSLDMDPAIMKKLLQQQEEMRGKS
mmetsp:Transcript_47445/g.122779  ORF Transcript_47445/g.122779 Transcript_47445/m.122779 type:complete len:485 (-) Transcript_47445:2725-4179(-)